MGGGRVGACRLTRKGEEVCEMALTVSHRPEIAGIDPFDDCDFCREIVDFDKMS